MASIRPRLKPLFLRLLGVFLLFFLFRLLYGYVESGSAAFDGMGGSDEGLRLKRNYASAVIMKEAPNAPPPPPGQQGSGGSQKYERVANIRSRSGRFEEDEKAVKAQIRQFKGIIQYEKNQGNAGERSLFLQIGVAPALFDSFYVVMQQYGRVLSKEATKTDMTSEFLQLNAKRNSLEKTRASLLELKQRGSNIADLMSLENNLLDIERQLQELGVELGAYDEENEFCTVRFSLSEGREHQISFLHRVKVALEWTLGYYCLFVACLSFALLAAWALLGLVDRWNKG